MHAQCMQWLRDALPASLDEAEAHLYARADRSRDANEQQQCLHGQLLIQRQRGALEKYLLGNVHEQFNRLGSPLATTTGPDSSARKPLALLDQIEHEMTVAAEKAAMRAETHNSEALFELGHRVGKLLELPPLQGEALVPGPRALAKAFRDATGRIDLVFEHRMLLMHCFDTKVMHALPALYHALNQQLVANGILPEVRHTVPASAEHPPVTPADATAPAAATMPSATAAPSATAEQSIAAISPSVDTLTLEQLGTLLARFNGSHVRPSPPPGAPLASTTDVQRALGHLQQRGDDANAMRYGPRNAKVLHDELFQQLNANRPGNAPSVHLSAEQGDTVELVAMLFDHMGRQLHYGGNAMGLLGDLQLPLLHLAMVDRGFFEQREHPARKLLGTVAEASIDWLDGPDGADSTFAAKLGQIVERTRVEHPSPELYRSLQSDVDQQLAQLERKAQLTERRQVEALQGRERLELACRKTATLMTQRCARLAGRANLLLRTLLERAWSDVLALTLLRHGEESAAYAQRLHVTSQLLGEAPVEDSTRLHGEIHNGLLQIGLHATEAEQISRRLLPGAPPVPEGNESSLTELVYLLRHRHRLGENSADQAAAHQATVTPPAPAEASPVAPEIEIIAPGIVLDNVVDMGDIHTEQPAEQPVDHLVTPPVAEVSPDPLRALVDSIYQRLRKTPFGTWYEWTDPATAHTVQRKLAWYSPISGHCLFVTRRGLRAEETTLLHLARDIACGHVREMPAMRENMFDRAWHALVKQLREFGKSVARHPGALEGAV